MPKLRVLAALATPKTTGSAVGMCCRGRCLQGGLPLSGAWEMCPRKPKHREDQAINNQHFVSSGSISQRTNTRFLSELCSGPQQLALIGIGKPSTAPEHALTGREREFLREML